MVNAEKDPFKGFHSFCFGERFQPGRLEQPVGQFAGDFHSAALPERPVDGNGFAEPLPLFSQIFTPPGKTVHKPIGKGIIGLSGVAHNRCR